MSRYFIRYFDELNSEENYIIAPQASSKYYLKNEYKHVGASWLTKENTEAEIKNVMANLNAIYYAEQIPANVQFYVLGFSQGVSVALRWVSRFQITCDKLIIYAGSIPSELTTNDFAFINPEKTKILNIVGLQDEYLRSDGTGRDFLQATYGGSSYKLTPEIMEQGGQYAFQEGRTVFKNAVSSMADAAQKVIERNNLTTDTVDWFAAHQANKRILDATGNRVGLAPEKVMMNIEKYGNTTSATLPLLINDYESKLKKGDNVIFAAFGGGFNWGSIYLKWAY